MKILQQVAKFGVVGVLNTAIDLGVLNLLVYFGIGVLFANTISTGLAITNSFLWNKYWTFRDKDTAWHRQIIPFFISAIVGLLLSNLLVYIFHIRMGWDLNLVKIGSFVIIFWWNFYIPKLFIFKR